MTSAVPPMTSNLFELADQAYLEAVEVFPDLPDIRLVISRDAGMSGRSYGYFEMPGYTIALSPRLIGEVKTRQLGVIRHELGHAIHERYGRENLAELDVELPVSDERLADSLAEYVWGSPIYYDEEEVQNTAGGVSPRPAHLG